MTLTPAPGLWKLELASNLDLIDLMEQAVTDLPEQAPLSVSSYEVDEDARLWALEALFDNKPDEQIIKAALKNALKASGTPLPDIQITQVEDRDWVRESQILLKPIEAGRFYIYGSHDRDTVPAGKTGLLVDAGQAFGSGSHETTHGCLLVLDDLADNLDPGRVLDLGCGSGILGMAASKVWDCLIVGSDIDSIATATALENARINNIPVTEGKSENRGFAGITAAGLDNADLQKLKPFDLVFANILMEPLLELAPGISEIVAAGGLVILSGLLNTQESKILARYEACGFKLKKRVPLGNWHTLLIQRI